MQKGLNDYLEVKRLFFPRFFFLSNDELLEILSETKDPTRVQPHLGKCFEGIGKLQFEGGERLSRHCHHALISITHHPTPPSSDANTITAMISPEGEVVSFGGQVVQPSSMVEQWLVDVEKNMYRSMARVIDEGLEKYKSMDRPTWCLQEAGQTVITVTQMCWTADVDAALQKAAGGEKDALGKYHEQLVSDLNGIVEKVRGKLSKIERKVMGPLIVMDVHSRDVIGDMVKKNVAEPTAFDWLAQMRFYSGEGGVRVKMISTDLPYGYEYIGLQGRLVVTPLTDRCYRTLMGALQLDLGGAPEGPAGTGKTETVKDLGKATARQTVVMNCSDGLDYLAMAKFFKGLAAAGAWACFDEFNRIDLEVLSVIAQQILTIQRAKSAKVASFTFEGTELPLVPTCAVFITMNPGYAGRSDLPDNLKALFRTVAMMVPDYAMIGEVMLLERLPRGAPVGAQDRADVQAVLRAAVEPDHYDYGMRAVMAVLRRAAGLKQQFPEEDENILMLRSIIDVNLPKFLQPDVPLFNGIASDLFPGVELPKADYDMMHECCLEYCAEANLQLTEKFFIKVTQLYETIVVT